MSNYEPEQVMDTPWLPLESAVMDWVNSSVLIPVPNKV